MQTPQTPASKPQRLDGARPLALSSASSRRAEVGVESQVVLFSQERGSPWSVGGHGGGRCSPAGRQQPCKAPDPSATRFRQGIWVVVVDVWGRVGLHRYSTHWVPSTAGSRSISGSQAPNLRHQPRAERGQLGRGLSPQRQRGRIQRTPGDGVPSAALRSAPRRSLSGFELRFCAAA